MSQPLVAILLSRSEWQILTAATETLQLTKPEPWESSATAQAVQAIVDAVSDVADAAQAVALLLDSDLVLTAKFSVDSPRQLRKPDAMLYELEEWLPVAAEDLSPAYIRSDLDVLAITAVLPCVKVLISGLEDTGLKIDLVMPLLPLAVERHLERVGRVDSHSALWLRDDGRGDLVQITNGRLATWIFLPEAEQCLLDEWQYATLQAGQVLSLHVYHSGSPPQLWLNKLDGVNIVPSEACEKEPIIADALNCLREIRRGRREPVAPLAGITATSSRLKDPLRWDVRLVQLAFVLLLGATTLINWQAAATLNAESRRLNVAAEDVFRNVFPNSSLRSSVRARLESELAKLAGARADSNEVDFAGSVLPLLFDLLSALPEQMRFRLLEIRLDGQELHLTGEVRSFSDADRIAAALRGRGLSVTPPTTQRLPQQGVSFRLVASARADNVDGEAKNGT